MDQTEKNMLFFHPDFHFFFGKNAGSSTGKFWMKKWKKTRSKNKCTFCARSFWRLLDFQNYCGILFWYKYWCPESLEYVRPLHSHYGRPLFQKVSKILTKNRSWGTLSEEKCCPRRVQQKNIFLETNFIYMNFIRLQGLAAGTVYGRNNGLLHWSMEFDIRAKNEFSYRNKKKRGPKKNALFAPEIFGDS